MPAVPVIATAGAVAGAVAVYEKTKAEKKLAEKQAEVLEKQAQAIEQQTKEASKMAETQTIPDRQDQAIQDLTDIVRDLSKTISNTYYEIQLLKNIQTPPQKIEVKTEPATIDIKTILPIIIGAGIILLIFFLVRREK